MRPYIVSHMMMSVDGRIDCPVMAQLSGDEYYDALAQLEPCSKLSGRVTAALECSAARESGRNGAEGQLTAESVNVACKSDEYTIVVDTFGRLDWISNEADGHPVLTIMSESVSPEYLESLKSLGISWIATGKKEIDLRRAVEILKEQFGVDRLAIVGGGNINGGFLAAGLLDEVSVMIAPGIDGRKGMTSVFDGITGKDNTPYRLKLNSIEKVGDEVLWLRYKTL